MRQHADKWMEMAPQYYKGNKNRQNLNAPQPLDAGQYVYIYRPPMKTSAVELMGTKLYSSKLMSLELSSFKVADMSPGTLTMDGNSIWSAYQ